MLITQVNTLCELYCLLEEYKSKYKVIVQVNQISIVLKRIE